jgi:drug/metabolite transporter (DMT)-like permease
MEIGKPQIKMQSRLASDLILLTAAIIWGGGFVAQRAAAPFLGFFSFNGIRFLLAGIVMLPFVLRRFKLDAKNTGFILLAGFLLFGGSALQQAGIETTTAGAAGFITGVYVVLVPIFLAIFWRQRTSAAIWVAALAALAGTYLLSTGGKGFNPSTGDLIVLAGSFVWSLHVIVVGFAVRKMDAIAFSVGQFLICGVLHLGMSLFIEPATVASVKNSLLPLAYAGLCSVALGFTLQAVGQRFAPAADAALILSLEAVFAALAGWLVLGENLSPIQYLGCGIILSAIIAGQLIGLKQPHNPVS